MTLKSRNRFFFAFFIFSLITIFCYIAVIIYSVFTDSFLPPSEGVRPLNLFKNHLLFKYDSLASLISIGFFLIYTSVVTFILFSGFEKTQSSEIIYFMGFIFSCYLEGTRLILPVYGLWKTNSLIVYLIGRCVFAGRFMAPLSLLFASLFNDADQRQDVERNLLILLVVSILFSVFIPINTTYIYTTCTIAWNYRALFNVVRVILFLLALITTIINAVKISIVELKEYIVGFLILVIGYSLLQVADNYATLIPSALLFLIGTVYYLKSIHKIYMWR